MGAVSTPCVAFQRQVLGVYNSAEGKTAIYNPLRLQVEMALNFLGLKLEYHDISQGLPGPEVMDRYRGIIVWFEGERMEDARAEGW